MYCTSYITVHHLAGSVYSHLDCPEQMKEYVQYLHPRYVLARYPWGCRTGGRVRRF